MCPRNGLLAKTPRSIASPAPGSSVASSISDAEFLYVPADAVMAVAEREGAIPYDVPGVEFGHVDGRCSFESILLKYDLAGDPALTALAKIVHAADVAADIETDPAGLGPDGYRPRFAMLLGRDDRRKIELEIAHL